MIHDLRVDMNSLRARRILKYFLKSPIPRKIQRIHHREQVVRHSGHLWWPFGRVLDSVQRKQTIATFLASGPPYPLDMCWHLENLLLPHPQFFGESYNLRSYSSFPRFGQRLRELKFYMDNQKPSGWYQMWKDKRDRVQYVTFWAVLVFGIISVVLALGSLVVSSAQTAAAFRALSRPG